MSTSCVVCQGPGTKRCSGCQVTTYCSVEHQKKHWKLHKTACRSFVIQNDEKYGNYIVAARDIEPGSILMNEPSIMVGPKQDTMARCLGCHKTLITQLGMRASASRIYCCTKCSFPMCGPECEKIPVHAANECKVFAKYKLPNKFSSLIQAKNSRFYESIFTLRCLLLKTKKPKLWKQLLAMEHHNEHRLELHMLWNRNEEYTVKILREHCHMEAFEEMEIHSVIGYADVNGFEIKTKGMEVQALFNNAYLMAHDCVSNTHHMFTEDCRMIVRACVPIKKGDMITTSYTSTLDGTLERRKALRDSKFFECECPRCADPTECGTYLSGVKCSKCNTGYLLPRNPLFDTSNWNCNICDKVETVNHIQDLTADISEEIYGAEIQGMESLAILKSLEGILTKYSGTVLHPNHFLLTRIAHSLSQLYGRLSDIEDLDLNDLKRKELHCQNLLRVVDAVEPGLSRIRGVTMYELQAAIFYSERAEFQLSKTPSAEMKKRLEQVLDLIRSAVQILSFDSPNSSEGGLAAAGSSNIQGVLDLMHGLFNSA